MKLYRRLDDKGRLAIPKDVLAQVKLDSYDEVEIDIIELNDYKTITISKMSDLTYNDKRKVLKE